MTTVVFIYHHQVSTAAVTKIMSKFVTQYRNARSPLLALVPIRPTGSLEKQRKQSSNHAFVVELKVMHTIKVVYTSSPGGPGSPGIPLIPGMPLKVNEKNTEGYTLWISTRIRVAIPTTLMVY